MRGNNEDRLVVFDLRGRSGTTEGSSVTSLDPPGLLLIVADGMGGMLAGEMASQMCVENLPARLAGKLGEPAVAWASREEVRAILSEAFEQTHELIYNRSASSPDLKGMGTTCTAALLAGLDLLIGQVGDSRAYLGREREVTQLTRDQTVWESMRGVAQDPGTAFRNAPWKNMLMQAVGAQESLQVECTWHTLQPKDWLLMCSDGLYRVVTPQDMARVLRAPSGPEEKARELVALANQKGGPDNISVILCEVLQAAPG